MTATVHCLDCSYHKRCHGKGGIGAVESAQRSRSGHLNRRACEHVVVLSDAQLWLHRRGFWPAAHVNTYRAAAAKRDAAIEEFLRP